MSGVVVPWTDRVICLRCFQSLDVQLNASDDVECGEFCEPTAGCPRSVSSQIDVISEIQEGEKTKRDGGGE